MNMLKRSLAMLLVLAMLFSVVPFSVFAEETVETTAATEAMEAESGAPGNSNFGHSQGKGKDKDKHKNPQDQTEATEVTEETVPETTVETVPETTEETVPEVTVPQQLMMAAAPATETEASTDGVCTYAVDAPDEFIRVFHLDVGRKYFTVDQVKDIIDTLAANYYTHMELALGNDGLRFLLDDMSVTVGETTYDSATVTAGVKAGNMAYAHAGEWSQTEMDAIIAYAKTKGIEIIPLINTPGHMDTILDAMESCGISGSYNGSARTVDIINAAAVAFTQELVGKYMDYFASKGCTYFNIGADEYANDVYTTGSMGWGHLMDSEVDLYDEFIGYVNQLVAMAADKGLRPIAFNDGIYFEENTSFGTFDTRLMIAYWSCGWDGFKPAPASFLAGKGHHILNTNDGWYYVLGRDSSTYGYSGALSNATNTSVTTVTGDDYHVVTPIGAMQCVWCDTPSVSYDSEVALVKTLIQTLADNNTDYFKAPEVTEPTPVVDETTKVSVTAQNVTAIEVAPVTENLPTIEAAAEGKVVAFEMTPKTEDGTAYTGEAAVSIPVPAEWTNVRGGVLESAAGSAAMNIEGELLTAEDGTKTFTFTAPHFSTVVAYELETAAEEDQDKITGTDGGVAYKLATEFTAGGEYVIVNRSSDGNGYALTNNNGSATRTSVTVANGEITSLTEANDDNVLWTISGTSDATVLNNGYTLCLTRYYSFDLTEDNYTFTVSNQGNGAYRIYCNANSRNNYLTYSSNAWTKGSTSGTSNIASVYLFQKVDTTAYTVNAALQESRIDDLAAVTNDGYTEETWTAYQNALTAANEKLTEVAGETYNSETAANTALNELIKAVDDLKDAKDALVKGVAITINYVDENEVTVKTETKTVAENATSVTLTSPIYDDANNCYIFDDTTLELTAGKTEYTVNVTYQAEDLLKVTPVQLEWWITNLPVNSTDSKVPDNSENSYNATGEGSDSKTIYYSVITAENAYGEAGMEIKPSVTVPATGSWPHSQNLSYWKSTCLTEDNKQNLDAGRDQTAAGTDFKYIRYYGREWEVSYDRVTWTTVNDTDQLVAYYLQSQEITPEVDILFKDWGYVPGNGENVSSVALSVAVVYPDGTLSPVEESDDSNASLIYPNASIIFNYSTGRDIGIVAPVNNSIYNISKITVTDGTRDQTRNNKWAATDTITWEKKTIEYTDLEWYDERTVWTPEEGGTPMVNGKTDNVVWPAGNTAVLVLIYLEPVKYDNNLIVKWVDDNSSALIHEMQVNVSSENETKNFYDVLEQTSEIPAEGVGGYFTLDDAAYVTNSSGVNQTFNKQITTIPTVAAQYKSGLYKYVGADLNKEGTVLTLHYNVDPTKLAPMYVIDFGLPMVFPISDLVENPGDMKSVEIIEQPNYGTAVLADNKITYTPTSILQAIDVLPIKVTFTTNTSATVRVGITPATTVYYEEDFLLSADANDEWDTIPADPALANQETEVLGEHVHNYGFDDAYDDVTTDTGYITGGAGAYTSFTFTGTGFQLYGNSNSSSGYVTVMSQGGVNKLYMINTKLSTGSSAATNQQSGGTYHNLPFISETNLPFGTYTVKIKQTTANDDPSQDIYLDGVRILNTLNDQAVGEGNIFYADQEDRPDFYEVRDFVLHALGVHEIDEAIEGNDSQYTDSGPNDRAGLADSISQMAGQVYNHIAAESASAVIVDESESFTATDVQDLLDNGPKNELYLYNGQTLIFKFNTNRVAQLGLKAPTGSASFTLNGTEKTLNTSVDMFYEIAGKRENAEEMTVTITNTGANVLSVTLLKICDDPNAAFQPLTQADIEDVLMDLYNVSDVEPPVKPSEPVKPEIPTEPSKPTEPEIPSEPTKPTEPEETKPSKPTEPEEPTKPSMPEKQKDAKLKITYVNIFGRKVGTTTLVKTGTANQRCVFTASEIVEQAPANRTAMWLLPVVSTYGRNISIIVPVI